MHAEQTPQFGIQDGDDVQHPRGQPGIIPVDVLNRAAHQSLVQKPVSGSTTPEPIVAVTYVAAMASLVDAADEKYSCAACPLLVTTVLMKKFNDPVYSN